MKKEELEKILYLHRLWLRNKPAGVQASLAEANLVGVNLVEADLAEASLAEADLRGANLVGANLRRVNLVEANLVGANLRRVNLRGANLRGANLRRADLKGANLRKANLVGANLIGANLVGADLGYKTPLARKLFLMGACMSACDWLESQAAGVLTARVFKKLLASCPHPTWIDWLETFLGGPVTYSRLTHVFDFKLTGCTLD